MITEAQEAAVVQARGKSPKFKQDKRHPFLINVKDGRLFPNVGALRDSTNAGAKDYRIFTGSPKATHDERMKWLETQGATLPSRVVDSGEQCDDAGITVHARPIAAKRAGCNCRDAGSRSRRR